MQLGRIERSGSGSECSCSPYSTHNSQSHVRLRPKGSKAQRAIPALPTARAVVHVATVEMEEAVHEPEAELLSRDLLEEKFSRQDDSHIDNIQMLERMKGELSTVLQDLEGDSSMELSVGDWEKLSSARERHALDVQKERLEEAAQKEQRKQERAAKRAARKVAAEAPRGPEQAVSRSTLTASSAAGSRRSTRSAQRVRGARATAGSRTRTHAMWGKQRAGEVEESQLFAKSLGATHKEYIPQGNDAVADFLRNMPAHKLLTKADEAALAIKIQDWLSLQERFQELQEHLGRPPTNAEWAGEFGQSEGEFMERWKDGNRARHKMLTCNQRLVVSIARRYQDKGLDLADLIAEGMNGLIRSVEKFDHTKGFKFSTYATWWVRQAITRSIGDLSKTIRLPCHLNEMLGKIARCEREFVNDNRRPPKIEELAAILKMPVDKVQMIRNASNNPRALEDPLKQGDPESSTIGDGLEDNSEAHTQSQIVQHSMQVDMDMVLSTLSTREHGILRMRYGLDDGEPKTLEDIGNAFHVTRERIRQIENKALAKLKDPARHSTLQPYLTGAALEVVTGDPGWKAGINRDSSN